MARTRSLDGVEIRVLGALMEKEQTTPDVYPMTVNAIIAACNQKTNREPVTHLSETEVVEALDRLRHEVLAWRSEGARSERWEQRLDRRWGLDPAAKAVMTLLLLRGPQTPGELRTRAERLHDFASVEAVEGVLARLAAGPDSLVRELPRRPGQRESRWRHTVGGEAEVTGEALMRGAAEEVAAAPAVTRPRPEGSAPPAPAQPPATAAPSPVTAPSAALATRLERLEGEVAALRDELAGLRRRLGDA
jgi:uncharacterized protein